MPMRRHTRILTSSALAVVGLIGLAACGDTTADKPAGETAGEAAGVVDCAANPGETVTVTIPEFAFDPTPVQVKACDSVVWENAHTQAHTSTGKGDKAWSTDNIAAGESSEPVLFDESGSFAYICALHPFMKGTVEVS